MSDEDTNTIAGGRTRRGKTTPPVQRVSEATTMAATTEREREYNFSDEHERRIYPEGGVYGIRAMQPEEKREYLELLGKTKLEFDGNGNVIMAGGEPVRVSALTEGELVTFAAKFIGYVEKIKVGGKFIDMRSPYLTKVLRVPGRSNPQHVDFDAEGKIVTPAQKRDGAKVARTETLFAYEEPYWWVIRQALQMYEKNNAAREVALGN